MNTEYNKIRPFYDHEVNDAIKRILKEEKFQLFLSKYLLGKEDIENEIEQFSKINSVDDFQVGISVGFFKKIISTTITELKLEGFENIQKDKSYLFISNHRDIVLDSAMLQVALFDKGHKTTRTAIGNNLVFNDILMDISKLNKMFLVLRDGSVRELVKNSAILSSYIQHSIGEGESVWIAQRNGRTKDGKDATQQGLLKMLSMSGKENISEKIYNLNIVPVSVSYEYESCDILKTKELSSLKINGKYEKESGEDFVSIKTGVFQNKGNVKLHIGKPINSLSEQWQNFEGNENEFLQNVANVIDKQILSNYHLFANNYIAADMLCNSSKYAENYSQEEKNNFIKYLEEKLSEIKENQEISKEIFLRIYANPVFNKENISI